MVKIWYWWSGFFELDEPNKISKKHKQEKDDDSPLDIEMVTLGKNILLGIARFVLKIVDVVKTK